MGLDGVPEAWQGAPAEAWLAAVAGVRAGATACPNLLASAAHPAYREDPDVKAQVRGLVAAGVAAGLVRVTQGGRPVAPDAPGPIRVSPAEPSG